MAKMRSVELLNNRFPERIVSEFSKENLRAFPESRFVVDDTEPGRQLKQEYIGDLTSPGRIRQEVASDELKERIWGSPRSFEVAKLLARAGLKFKTPKIEKEEPFLVDRAAYDSIKARWDSGEVPLRLGEKYSYDGCEWDYIGTMSIGMVREYMDGTDCTIRSSKLDNVPAGYDDPNRVFIFNRQVSKGERILIANSSRGFKPVGDVDNNRLLLDRFAESMGKLVENIPPSILLPQHMIDIVEALDIRPGMRVLGVESPDPYFPLILAHGACIRYTACAKNFRHGGTDPDESTGDTPNLLIVYNGKKKLVKENGGRMLFTDSIVDAVRDAKIFHAAIIPNWLDRARTEDALTVLAMTYDSLLPGCRLLASPSRPDGQEKMDSLLHQCLPSNRMLEKVGENIITDKSMPGNGTVYELRQKK